MSYEHLRGVMGGTPHTTTGSATASATAVLRPHLSLVPEAPAPFEEPLPPEATDQWQDRALCAQTDPEAFFPEKGGSTREAKKICMGCEVRHECLGTPWLMTSGSASGVVFPNASAAASNAGSSDPAAGVGGAN